MGTAQLYGGIEAGGTKFVCAVGIGETDILAETIIYTTTPAETLRDVAEFFRSFAESGQLKTLGVGTFGPLDLDRASQTFGYIRSTPKRGWSNTDVAGTLHRALGVRVVVDTDVNAAALGESTSGASMGADPSLYITVGTGIGGGYIQSGNPLHGLANTEMGHLRIPHDLQRDPFPGMCPFHGDCLEGLASGPAIRARFEEDPEALPDEDPFWDLEADYLAAALMNYVLVLSPKKIILGGGVMQREFLYGAIRARLARVLNGYIESPSLGTEIDSYVVPPGLGSRSGVIGALVLARRAG